MHDSGSDESSGKSCRGGFWWVVLGCIVFLSAVVAVGSIYKVGLNEGYAPVQPIPFSHKRHVSDNGVPCLYCHSNADKSRHATVPSMNVCMNCHRVVRPDSPWIQQLKQMANEKKEPFQWVKVNDLADHVNFNHKRHVQKGVACESCHGDVKNMAVVRQDKPLTMGWCLDCHRGNTAPSHLARAPMDTPPNSLVEAGAVAPTNCYTCHQ